MLAPRPLAESFYTGLIVQRLRELGYREGSGMVLEYRATRAVPQRYPEMAHELVALKCDLIFAVGPDNGVIALRDARTSIPVVFLAIDFDPLQSGIVTSLGRPGSNITGVYVPQGELAAKRLDILREVVPSAKRFLIFSDSSREISSPRCVGAPIRSVRNSSSRSSPASPTTTQAHSIPLARKRQRPWSGSLRRYSLRTVRRSARC